MPLRDLFRRKPTPPSFARMLMQRLRQAGEKRKVTYDPENFSLTCADSQRVSYLHNAFAEYQRADRTGREKVIRVFLSAWFTTAMELPAELDLAKADLLVALRDRSYFEIDIPLHTGDSSTTKKVVYQEVAGCLAAAPVYDLPTAIRSIDAEELGKWGVTLYEALEIAKQNLAEMTDHYGKVGNVYIFAYGDGHDASRLLLTDRIESFDLIGRPVAMVPNRELVLVAGSGDEEALEQMLNIAGEALEHERRITGFAFELLHGEWHPWLPEANHPLHGRFALLRAQSIGSDYERQKHLLEKRLAREHAPTFVASYNATQDDQSGQVHSVAAWTQGVDTLLPVVDRLLLVATGSDGKPSGLAAAADWDRVEREVGYLMHAEVMYPERVRVMDFPSADELKRIGIAPWANKRT